jgi:hypothetical protein
MRRFLLLSLVLGSAALQTPLAAQAERQSPKPSFGGSMIRLQALIQEPVPTGLSPQDLAAYQEHTDWLKGVVARLEHSIKSPRDVATGQASGRQAVGQSGEAPSLEVAAPRDRASGQASGRQQVATVLSPDMDLLMKQIQEESQRFVALTGRLKARHDMAMSSIRNMKG